MMPYPLGCLLKLRPARSLKSELILVSLTLGFFPSVQCLLQGTLRGANHSSCSRRPNNNNDQPHDTEYLHHHHTTGDQVRTRPVQHFENQPYHHPDEAQDEKYQWVPKVKKHDNYGSRLITCGFIAYLGHHLPG